MNRKLSLHKLSSAKVLCPLLGEKDGSTSLNLFEESSALTVSEDEKYVYIEACVPGIKLEEIELSLNQGILWIKAAKRKEPKDKKKIFYCKAVSSFSYSIPLPNEVDETKTPETLCKNGVVKIKFNKKPLTAKTNLC